MASSTINREPWLARFFSCSPASLISSRRYQHLPNEPQLPCRERQSPTQRTSMSTPNSICVGIELEFLVALQQPDSGVVDGESRWTCPSSEKASQGLVTGDFQALEAPCIHKVCESIASNGVAVSCNLMPPLTPNPERVPGTTVLPLTKGSGIRVWNKEAAASKSGIVSRSDYWFVVPERHITLDCVSKSGKTPSDKYDWFGTELNSPILTHPQEFSQGLPTLRKCLTAVQDKMVVALNSGCGLHLHVNDAGSMDLPTAKRITSLVWLLEDALLYPLCHPFRSASPYSARVSVESTIAMGDGEPVVHGEGASHIAALVTIVEKLKDRKKVDQALVGAMKRLWAEPNLASLGKALRKFDEGPVHTTTRCALVVSKYDTIEFRYPESMFDVDFISGWADLVRHLYAVAMRSQTEFIQILCRVYELVTRDQVPGWPAMMEAVEFKTDLNRWHRRLDQYSGRLSNLDKQSILPQVGS
ncbi:hypothetical protein FDECE_1879 [Fusarium decemcellulare]|nr:hypothetical protein FDECE_1879 [Fusarium decemcellulare]